MHDYGIDAHVEIVKDAQPTGKLIAIQMKSGRSFFKEETADGYVFSRLNRLRIDRRWMDLIAQGEEVRVEFDDWVHKSLKRFQITVYTEDEKEAWPMLYTPAECCRVNPSPLSHAG